MNFAEDFDIQKGSVNYISMSMIIADIVTAYDRT